MKKALVQCLASSSRVKNLPAMQETQEIRVQSWVGKTPGEGNGSPLQDSCLGMLDKVKSKVDEISDAKEELKEEKDELVKNGAILIDVREDYEYNEKHLDNAINIPYTSILDNIDKYATIDSDIVLYCKSGKRASIAALTLKEAGYKHIYNLGGISNCKE